MSAKRKYPLLHIYGQHSPHDEVFITGNRVALIALRDAIEHALNNQQPQLTGVFAADGEGYEVHVIPRTDKAICETGMPYEYLRADERIE